MGYGDYTPSSHHPKKPLTRTQMKKLQEKYGRADSIVNQVKQQEQEERNQIEKDINNLVKFIE